MNIIQSLFEDWVIYKAGNIVLGCRERCKVVTLKQNHLQKKSQCLFTHLEVKSEKAMAPHSSTLAWKIPWTEEPGRLQSMGLLRVGHNWATSLLLFTFMHWRRKWQPTLVFLPGESRGRGAWWAAVYGVGQSQTRLKRLSSSSRVVWGTSKIMHLMWLI